MPNKFIEMMKERRTIYNIDSSLPISQEKLITLVKEAVKEAPSSFNSQTSRVVILFGDEHKKLWHNITKETLKEIVAKEIFTTTEKKSIALLPALVRFYFLKNKMLSKNYSKNFHFMPIIFLFGLNKVAGWHNMRFGLAWHKKRWAHHCNTTIPLLMKKCMLVGRSQARGNYALN